MHQSGPGRTGRRAASAGAHRDGGAGWERVEKGELLEAGVRDAGKRVKDGRTTTGQEVDPPAAVDEVLPVAEGEKEGGLAMFKRKAAWPCSSALLSRDRARPI